MRLSSGSQANRHPAPEILALLSRGDLSPITRLRVNWHVAHCSPCKEQVSHFRGAREELKREAASETLTAFEAIANWHQLEREMLGNIVVGVSAARCIDNVGRKNTWLPRLAVVVGLVALFAAGWITHIPGEQSRHLTSSLSRMIGLEKTPVPSNYVRATSSGIAVRSQGVTLTILHPPSAVISLSGNSSVEARYVDEDTGQLTITNVYGQ